MKPVPQKDVMQFQLGAILENCVVKLLISVLITTVAQGK